LRGQRKNMTARLNRNLISLFLSLLSSAILFLSFPPFDQGCLAWAGLLPLFLAMRCSSLWKGFLFSGICGAFFFLGLFNWIVQVSSYRWYHHALLDLYLGAYFGIFGLAFAFVSRRISLTAALWSAPFLWVGMEYIRSNSFFLALPWGLLGHTQYRYPMVIQIAALFGTYSISFLIVLVNAALAVMIHSIFTYHRNSANRLKTGLLKKTEMTSILGAVLAVSFALVYGQCSISRPIRGRSIKVSIIQGNIEQSKKWDPEYADEIVRIYNDLTLHAAADNPALIIWPETATPGLITMNPEIYKEVENLVQKTATPLIFGSARYQKFQTDETPGLNLINSAFLMVPGNNKPGLQQYNKIRLFPFGEYLPFKFLIPWKWIGVSSLSEYVPGEEYTVFYLSPNRFGVTICWENIFPDLVRQFVKRGAQFIVNITNEARFGKTAAPHQLVAINVFRAVENGVYIIRCANTGVSCIIDFHGRIVKRLQDEEGQDLFVRGILHGTIIPMESKTLYLSKGYLFPILVVGVFLVLIFIAWWKPLAKGRIARDTKQ
jgi:apolipoprotein N-acyltransferase